MFSRISRQYFLRFVRHNSGGTQQNGVGAQTQAVNVPGLSNAVVKPSSQPVGPGVDPTKSGAYKAPEYYCYNDMSFFEAEIEMAKYRCPQPSSLKKN